MFIRVTERKNRDGSTVQYVQLAHNERDPEKGHPVARILYNFGRADQLDLDVLRRLVRSIHRFLGPEEALQAQAQASAAPLRFKSSRPLGGAWALDGIWRQLGIPAALGAVLKQRQFRTPIERTLFALVANRALAPASKLAVEDWVADDVALPGLQEVEVQQLYRTMDFLLEAGEPLQEAIYFSVADLLNLEVDLLYFDSTSTYFEIEDEDEPAQGSDRRSKSLRRRGHSKDHRPDCPQVVIGLAVTRDGIPVRCWVWPGNTADMSVIQQVKNDLVGWRLGRVITVVDRGFASEENLRYLQRAGGHYIAGERLRAGKPAVEDALSRPGRYQKVRDNLEVKEIVVGDGEARVRYVLVRNPEEARRDAAKREQVLKQLRAELEALKELPGGQHSKACCALLSHPTYGRYLRTDRHGRAQIDPAKIAEDERLDGKYLVRTSDDTLSAEDVALGYKQLLEVEDAFRTLKQRLELRPVYHRLDDRIRAHVLLCWLALLLVRVAERKTGQTWLRLRAVLQRVHLGEFEGADGRVWQRTELTPEQRQIFTALGVPEPPKILDIRPARQATA